MVNGLTPVTDFVDVEKISLLGGTFRYPQQSLQFSSLNVQNPKLSAWLKENGDLSVMDLISASESQQVDMDQDAGSSPWQLGIDLFELSGGSVALTDRSINPAAEIGIRDLQISISDISNQDDASMPFGLAGELDGGGGYKFNGNITVLPGLSLSATVNTRDIPLTLRQSYVQQFAHILIESGAVDSDIEINLPVGGEFSLAGSIRIPGLEVSDTIRNKRLLAWNELDIDHFDLNSDGLHVSLMTFEQAFGRFVIFDDQTTNLSALVIEQPASEPSDPMTIIIGGIRVNEASMDFADLSLPLPFATEIAHLNGTISTIATNSNAPANIKLEGQVDEFGLARIDGSMNLLDPIQHTDITVEFRNLAMSSLSPYSVQFAGREIDEGKLDLGLVYAIDEGQMHGSNDVVLSDLLLGDKVDHPDAMSLPLGLAVGLLKEADGVIKIDLPVEGDINDPEFKIGGVIWQAISGMITKLVSAPFRLLGKLIGIDSEDLGQFEFLAGRSDLTPPEMEKITQLEEALVQRPELKLEIAGVIDPAIDVPALKFIRLRDITEQRLQKDLAEENDETMMFDIEIRAVVETLFIERFPQIPLENIKVSHTAAPDPESRPVLDDLAYATDLWSQLLESEVISEQHLTELANARAEIISAAFLASGKFDPGRVVIAEAVEVESEDGEWVKLELSVASD